MKKHSLKTAFVTAPYRSFDRFRKGGKHITNGIKILGGELLESGLSDVKIFDGAFYRSFEDLVKSVNYYSPDVLAIPGYTDSMPETERIFDNIEAKIKITGGPYSSARPQELLGRCDVVFIGEAETSLKKFYEMLNDKGSVISKASLFDIPGIAFSYNEEVVFTEDAPLVKDLDSISLQDWYLVKDYIGEIRIANYRHLYQEFANIMSSRGCNKSCVFCSSNFMHGRGYRFTSPENVEEEIELIEYIRKEKGLPPLKSIKFDDDDIFARDFKDLEKLFGILARRGLTYTGFASIKAASKDVIKLASETGMKSVFFGIETHEGRRKYIGKGKLSDDEIKETLDECRKNEIFTSAGYIIGFPTETREDIEKTIDSMVYLPVDYPSLNILTIHPGTYLWRYQEQHADEHPELRNNPFTHVDRKRFPSEPEGLPSPHPKIKKEELANLKSIAYRRAYTDENRIFRLMKSVKTPFDAKRAYDAISDFRRRE